MAVVTEELGASGFLSSVLNALTDVGSKRVYREMGVTWLIREHYEKSRRPLRRCHPRDLLLLVRHSPCTSELPLDLWQEYFAEVVKKYFTIPRKPGKVAANGNEVENP